MVCIVNITAQQNRHNYLIGVALKELLTFTIHTVIEARKKGLRVERRKQFIGYVAQEALP